jgi:hypothetical protein
MDTPGECLKMRDAAWYDHARSGCTPHRRRWRGAPPRLFTRSGCLPPVCAHTQQPSAPSWTTGRRRRWQVRLVEAPSALWRRAPGPRSGRGREAWAFSMQRRCPRGAPPPTPGSSGVSYPERPPAPFLQSTTPTAAPAGARRTRSSKRRQLRRPSRRRPSAPGARCRSTTVSAEEDGWLGQGPRDACAWRRRPSRGRQAESGHTAKRLSCEGAAWQRGRCAPAAARGSRHGPAGSCCGAI